MSEPAPTAPPAPVDGRPRLPAPTVPAATWLAPGQARLTVTVFCVALTVRLLYLSQAVGHPNFFAPVVDALKYDMMAREWVRSGHVLPDVFYQSCFYPFFLTLVYAVTGCSMVAARVAQAFVGSGTCVLTALLARRLLGPRAGLVAGLAAAVYGPLVYYDVEPLSAVWACFWSPLLVLILLRADERPDWRIGLALGATTALTAVTVPSFLPVAGAGAAWVAWRRGRGGRWTALLRRDWLRLPVAALAAFLLTAAPFALANQHATGRFTILPAYGGLNFYIGNNPNKAVLETIRPGPEWEALKNLPERQGVTGAREQQAWFYRQGWSYAASDPLGFARNCGRKVLEFVTTREEPNSESIYFARPFSPMLAALVWKVGGVGFPACVLLPMAALGFFAWRRRGLPGVLPVAALVFAVTIIAVHVCARYRLPVIPWLIVAAVAGGMELLAAARAKRWRALAVMLALAAATAALGSVPGPFPREAIDFEYESLLYRGFAALQAHRETEAEGLLRKAAERDPAQQPVHIYLARVYLSLKRPAKAETEARRAEALAPEAADGYYWTGMALAAQGKLADAAEKMRHATELDPASAESHHILGLMLADLGRLPEGLKQVERAAALAPSSPAIESDLAAMRRAVAGESAGAAPSGIDSGGGQP